MPQIYNRVETVGSGASNTADDGAAPVKIATVYRAAPASGTDGDKREAISDSRGNLRVAIAQLSNVTAVQTHADASANSQLGLVGAAFSYGYNGTNWDRLRVANVFKTLNAVVVTSETTIWTPAGGKKFRLMGMLITQGVVTGAITLKDNTGGTTIAIIPPHTIAVAMPLILFGNNGILSSAANQVLTATGASTETVTGTIFGTEE